MGAEGLAQRNGAQPEADTSRVRARSARPIERMPMGAGCNRCKRYTRSRAPSPTGEGGGSGLYKCTKCFQCTVRVRERSSDLTSCEMFAAAASRTSTDLKQIALPFESYLDNLETSPMSQNARKPLWHNG